LPYQIYYNDFRIILQKKRTGSAPILIFALFGFFVSRVLSASLAILVQVKLCFDCFLVSS